MKNIIQWGVSTLLFGLLIFCGNTVSASELSEREYLQKEEVQLSNVVNLNSLYSLKSQQNQLSKMISIMSDEEFDRFIYNVVKNNIDDYSVLTEKLNALGVEFIAPTKNQDTISVQNVSSNQLTLTSYSSKRVTDSYYRISGMWDASIAEVRAATEDPVSIEWNPNVGVYYGSAGDNYVTSVSDVSKRAEGIVVFTVVDSYLNFDGYATVYVTKKSSSVGKLFHGIKYIHTYSQFSNSSSGTASIQFSKDKGLTGGLTFSVNQTTNVESWQKWDDNDLYW